MDRSTVEAMSAEQAIAWALEKFHPRIALASSFGAEDVVLIDLLLSQRHDVRIFTLDTGRLNEETHEVAERVRARYGVTIETYVPDHESVERFVRDHPRRPYPDKLSWETDLSAGTNRAHWLVVDELAKPSKTSVLPDLNEFPLDNESRRQTTPLFFHFRPSGRVDLVREGNTVRVSTRGVKAFTLLVSPDVFDFDKPVQVIADGRTVFDGVVKKDLSTLMRWAAQDDDRTMLFGGEIHVRLTP